MSTAAALQTSRQTLTVRWAVIVLLSLGMILAYASRSNLAVALAAPEFIRAFHLSDTERGLLNSAGLLHFSGSRKIRTT
jgi:sugar phosphate permease